MISPMRFPAGNAHSNGAERGRNNNFDAFAAAFRYSFQAVVLDRPAMRITRGVSIERSDSSSRCAPRLCAATRCFAPRGILVQIAPEQLRGDCLDLIDVINKGEETRITRPQDANKRVSPVVCTLAPHRERFNATCWSTLKRAWRRHVRPSSVSEVCRPRHPQFPALALGDDPTAWRRS